MPTDAYRQGSQPAEFSSQPHDFLTPHQRRDLLAEILGDIALRLLSQELLSQGPHSQNHEDDSHL